MWRKLRAVGGIRPLKQKLTPAKLRVIKKAPTGGDAEDDVTPTSGYV